MKKIKSMITHNYHLQLIHITAHISLLIKTNSIQYQHAQI